MSAARASREQVAAFWNAEACGERYGSEQERLRYALEPEIIPFAGFSAASGRRLLEVGVGMGADFVRFVRAGATATGVDLTERSVALTRDALEREGLQADVTVADAENLPFGDGAFDIVYSWGVLHHSPSPSRAIEECLRVLAPGGELRIMLYHRRSWVALAAWFRFCALRGRPFASLTEGVANIESPGTKAFTAQEIRVLLPQLTDLKVEPRLTHWDRKWAPGISRILGNRFGWFLLINGRKPLAAQAAPGSEGVGLGDRGHHATGRS